MVYDVNRSSVRYRSDRRAWGWETVAGVTVRSSRRGWLGARKRYPAGIAALFRIDRAALKTVPAILRWLGLKGDVRDPELVASEVIELVQDNQPFPPPAHLNVCGHGDESRRNGPDMHIVDAIDAID